MVADVRSMTAEMKGMVEDIRRRTQYTDRSSEVKHLVDELGGYDAVANSDAKLDEVVKHLDSGQQIEIAVLKKQAHAGLMALEAAQEQGAHRLVKHTDMRTFWRMCFKGLPKVDWEVWWEAFPSQLMAVVPDKAVVEQVTSLLSTEADLWQFQKAVEKNDGETISVKEVNDTFPSYMSIPKAVGRALGLREDGASEATAISGSPEAEVLYRESLASACLESQGKEEPKTLKDAPTMYSGQVQPSAARHPKMAVEEVAAEIPPMETGPCICEAGRLVNLGGRPVPKHCRPACNVKNPVGEEEGMPGTQFGWALQQQLQGGRVMNGRLADKVEVQPPDLRFRLVLGKQLLATISINNPLERRVAFKILIKAPKKYVVRPSGIAEAHSQVNVQVIMQAQQEYPPDFQNCRDKFKIQVTPLESMETLNKDTFNKEMRTDMWEHLLCVIMESPAALPSRVKQEQKDLHQELGEGEFVLRATAEPLPIIHDGRPRWQNEVQVSCSIAFLKHSLFPSVVCNYR
ncbi:hypothetical protein DUNSADRAFT_16359 [Dunaliella salina]|uniref:MSP domain-containing protein n=1 Tax=Dunaliella salina TaxID=3046 RepID=A0ABQ7H140_DUNSA|nr:hypothetical protein DUNSADRAFT_16359 [Dunaliella salina]|eukprot:KAF5840561.1 hypothetical protein DUNSADRAFT_16359 [Dunaliella salina]